MADPLTPEQIEQLSARDGRIAALRLSIDLEADLRDNGPLTRVMASLRADADQAIEEFAVVNPADSAGIMDLQARVYRFVIARNTFRAILGEGSAAEDELRSQDR